MTARVRTVDRQCSEETLRPCLLGRQRVTEKPREKQRGTGGWQRHNRGGAGRMRSGWSAETGLTQLACNSGYGSAEEGSTEKESQLLPR